MTNQDLEIKVGPEAGMQKAHFGSEDPGRNTQ